MLNKSSKTINKFFRKYDLIFALWVLFAIFNSYFFYYFNSSRGFIKLTASNYKTLYIVSFIDGIIVFILSLIIGLFACYKAFVSKKIKRKIKMSIYVSFLILLIFQFPFFLRISEFSTIEKGVIVKDVEKFQIKSERFRGTRSRGYYYERFLLVDGKKFFIPSRLYNEFNSPNCLIFQNPLKSIWQIECNLPVRLHYLDMENGLISIEKV